ncbi:MAG: caspase family protein [Scytolyngbya sp. HA4215-MV1]|jgi:hypothetical protein|nr:caspase family protein [Scytolyngbya sp. HA4215-MV1]
MTRIFPLALLSSTALLIPLSVHLSTQPLTISQGVSSISRLHQSLRANWESASHLASAWRTTVFPEGRSPSTRPQPSGQFPTSHCQTTASNFLVIGGGGAPSYNEIAIEKNVLYFQRTLKLLGLNPASASIFFANGNNGQATVRYRDAQGQEQFKPPEIPNLHGPATRANLQRALQQAVQLSKRPLFFYFTGHGAENERNHNNNALILWGEDFLSVQQFTQILDRLPPQTPVVTMMAQCYSGSFANFIYQAGNPNRAISLQTRCGFFATVKDLPSIGCTPEVNEADYRDYSSSFFAGLSGRNRIGQPVASADYNHDGRIAYNEAHAFAKVDEQGIDLPISTSESWLRNRLSKADKERYTTQPIANLLQTARPEQRYVVTTLGQKFGFNLKQSFDLNWQHLDESQTHSEIQQAYATRLWLELLNIGAEKQLRTSRNAKQIAVLDRLLKCESGSWK